MKRRVFVSSAVTGFEDFRQAAREGIEAAGGEPILVNEDFPALPVSARNACLDAVDSADLYIVVLGERGGWTAPSGKLAVEEEYERARAKKLPILVFIQRSRRDADAERLLQKVSDYTDGTLRHEFTTPDELRSAVQRALAGLILQTRQPIVDPEVVTDRLRTPQRVPNEVALHFVLVPERDEEVVDIVELGRPEFARNLLEIAHRGSVGLLSYMAAKTKQLGRTSLSVRQEGDRRREEASGTVRLEVGENGLIAIDLSVNGSPTGTLMIGLASMLIVRGEVESLLRSAFAFADAWYAFHDPHRRHQRFHYGVAITGLRYQTWVDQVPAHSNSLPMGRGNHPDPLLILPRPRPISRDDLGRSDQEIERLVTLMGRELSLT